VRVSNLAGGARLRVVSRARGDGDAWRNGTVRGDAGGDRRVRDGDVFGVEAGQGVWDTRGVGSAGGAFDEGRAGATECDAAGGLRGRADSWDDRRAIAGVDRVPGDTARPGGVCRRDDYDGDIGIGGDVDSGAEDAARPPGTFAKRRVNAAILKGMRTKA